MPAPLEMCVGAGLRAAHGIYASLHSITRKTTSHTKSTADKSASANVLIVPDCSERTITSSFSTSQTTTR